MGYLTHVSHCLQNITELNGQVSVNSNLNSTALRNESNHYKDLRN